MFVPTSYRDYSGGAVKVLVGAGANVNDNSSGCTSTPLELAVVQGNEAAVHSLLDAKDISLRLCEKQGVNPFLLAVIKGYLR